MEIQGIAKQMIDLQKAVFNNYYYDFSIIQDYSQNILRGYMRQFPWDADINLKPFDDSFDFFLKGT